MDQESLEITNDSGSTARRIDGNPKATEVPWRVLPSIVIAQFSGTSLWFAGNAVLTKFAEEFQLEDSALPILTSSVQLGFISGTLLLSITSLVDRVLPTHIFLSSALLGALTTALIPILAKGLASMFILRFLTGVSLAGIYPVGMKIAADWYQEGLGRALGLLLGALVAGTAFPFLLRQIPQSWEALLYETSLLSTLGGVLMIVAVPNGPHRKATPKFDPSISIQVFRNQDFQAAAMGYFGHMWELYAFWTWCPVVWKAYLDDHANRNWSESLVTFFVISMGALGCVIGGHLSLSIGSARVALFALMTSGLCCLLSPLVYWLSTPVLTLVFYLVWGSVVAADSPQFSSLVAQYIPAEHKGTALTLVNCIGFAISIGSIQLLGVPLSEQYLFLLLAPGPLYGYFKMRWYIIEK